ncbi:MAG: serine protease [Hungateiclostridium saccincola]|nr:serine protease [Acetivibrio saccincola]
MSKNAEEDIISFWTDKKGEMKVLTYNEMINQPVQVIRKENNIFIRAKVNFTGEALGTLIYEESTELYRKRNNNYNKMLFKDLVIKGLPIKTNAIVISRGDDVVRGQKVVAIGSPLGLMNTFSEGIISGFRKSKKCDFIQTTAPMSPGSSGGALLNMYGELIGIASAGFVEGQNINLAVPSKYILDMLGEKSTLISMELVKSYSSFSYNNIRVNFDGLFSSSIVGSYNILLYQSRTDKTNLLELVKNRDFACKLENHYINCISHLMSRHNIQAYEFQLGAGNYIFTYSYRKGEFKNKGWEYIKL